MTELLGVLKDLLPLWAVVLLFGFGYLIVLVKRASDRFLDIAEKQTKYLTDRVDVVDKSTAIFTRTIDQQEKEIRRLNDQVGRLSADLKANRETDARLSVVELTLLSDRLDALERAAAGRAAKAGTRTSGAARRPTTSTSTPDDPALARAIRARDLSVYPILLSPVVGADALIDDLRGMGYAASIYDVAGEEDSMPENSGGIWLGSDVPAENAVEIISTARRHWPFLAYVHLSVDSQAPSESHSEVYLGGSTESATSFLGCLRWTDEDFSSLSPTMTLQQLHAKVRSRYRFQQT
jgi:hypothetical protein